MTNRQAETTDNHQSPLERLLEREALLERRSKDQLLFIEEIGPCCTSSEEQQRDAFYYAETLQNLEDVKKEIRRLQQSALE